MALEGDEDISDVIERSLKKQARRSANKVIRESEGISSRKSQDVGARRGEAKEEEGEAAEEAECAAVSAAASVSAIDDFESGNGKRKRIGKQMSVTPSVVDEDMDDDCVRIWVTFLFSRR